jgi:hypothetical protein
MKSTLPLNVSNLQTTTYKDSPDHHRPIPVMGEETYKPGDTLSTSPTFILDPIDGTYVTSSAKLYRPHNITRFRRYLSYWSVTGGVQEASR